MASEFKTKVKGSWEHHIKGTKVHQMVGKLNRLKKVLKSLNKETFVEVEVKADQSMKELKKCQEKIQQNPHSLR